MTIPEILNGIKKQRALVVGDICLDRWCTYDPDTAEPSAETGIPRLGIVASVVTPGGGGTVANNLAELRRPRWECWACAATMALDTSWIAP